MNETTGQHGTRGSREVRPRRPLTIAAVSITATLALALAGCTGTPAGDSTSSEPRSSSSSTNPDNDSTSLEAAGMKASKLTERSTVISVESENSGTHWEVKVATDDGSEHETLINISDGNVVRGPDKKDTDAEDLAENRALLDGAEIDFKEAAELLRKQVPGGTVTELNLDDYLGKIVWEGDVHDSSGVKHELKIDAASGSAFSS